MLENHKRGLEVCANSLASGFAAENGGAIRIELCENMAEGGTTPSFAQIKLCKERLSIEVWPIIRPRGGDFLYDDIEFQLMIEDIKICKLLSCNGVVLGILKAHGEIDIERTKVLIDLAKPMPVAFHRAFDMSNNLQKSLDQLIALGIVRVLTSGGANSAVEGLSQIKKLLIQANGRIEIMPGAGINPQNIKKIKDETGACVFHSSARISIESNMEFRNKDAKMGNIVDEYKYQQTSALLVKEMVCQLNENK